jgi:hypothetical protein
MDFRSIILYLSRKLSTARDIHGDIIAMLRPDAVTYATMTRWLRKTTFISPIEESLESSLTRNRDEVDDAILLALAE